jgi:hypothetical protein
VNPATVTVLAVLNTAVPIGIGSSLIYKETAVPLGVVLLGWGWLAGPAPFNLYFGDTTGGLVGLGIRGGSMLAAAALTAGGTWDEDGSSGTEIALLSLIVISGVSAVLNFVDLPPAVRSYNETRMSVGIAPLPDGVAVSVAYRF